MSNHADPILEVGGLSKHFPANSGPGFLAGLRFEPDRFPPVRFERRRLHAVDDVSLEVRRGETLGLVGESGCGKSTLGRTLLRLLEPTAGRIRFDGEDITNMSGEALRQKRASMQLVFQDPHASMNPRLTVERIIAEPMVAHDMLDRAGRRKRVHELLEAVGLEAAYASRYPHEFSGGQRQRIALARALSVDPDFIVCDEPVSALDVSVQAQVLEMMKRLQATFDLTYLFIAHDLSVVRHVADRVAVMYLGQIVEVAGKEELFENPKHPYTKALLEAVPVPDPRASGNRTVVSGEVPSPIDPPEGCRFRTRCPKLIAPDAYEWHGQEWEQTRAFMRAVDRRTIKLDQREIRSKFFPDGVPDGERGEILEEALALLSQANEENEGRNERWEQAATLLCERFGDESICARERPAYTLESAEGGDRFTACHLHKP